MKVQRNRKLLNISGSFVHSKKEISSLIQQRSKIHFIQNMERMKNVFGAGAQYKPIIFLIFQSQGTTRIEVFATGFHTSIG